VRPLPVPPWRDLVAATGLALAGLIIAVAPLPDPVRTATLLPLFLVVPGYALAAALFMPGEISRELRAVLSVAFSFAVLVLGGVVVQLVIGLNRPVWATLITCVTAVAAVVALLRRDVTPMPADWAKSRPRLPRFGLASLAVVLAAMAIAGWAIAIATEGVHRQQDRAHFASLWLVPTDTSLTPPPVGIGVRTHQGGPADYRVTVRQGPRTIKRWRFRLDGNQEWQAALAPSEIPGTGPLIGQLNRGGRPLHRVTLQIGGPS
jgi:Protein of unknown function (DUF1616)